MSKLRGLSLFANVGIAEAYMKDIGVDMVLANEIAFLESKYLDKIEREQLSVKELIKAIPLALMIDTIKSV